MTETNAGRSGHDMFCVCGHVAVARFSNDEYHQFDAGTGKARCRTGMGKPECPCEDFKERTA